MITEDEKKLLAAVLAEREARGLPKITGVQLPSTKKDSDWNVDENGYFMRREDSPLYKLRPRFNPRDELVEFINSRARFILLRSGRGGSKALWIETPILTQNRGWQTMGSLVIGDVVFDERGKPCNVINKSKVMHNNKCYRVTFSDGSEIVADAGHLWFTQNKKERNGYGAGGSTGKVRTTEEMTVLTTIGVRKEKNYSIKSCEPLEYPEKSLPLHPYILGVWLGDGNSAGARVTTADPEILEELSSLGLDIKRGAGKYGYGISFPNTAPYQSQETGRMVSNPNNLHAILRRMGVINNKHIPREYLESSVGQRISLLQGLMDTDGTADTRGHCSYTTTSKRLFDGVLELCLTLGINAGSFVDDAYIVVDGRRKYCGKAYSIYINTNLPVFRLPRKLSRQKSGAKQGQRHERRFIKSIELVESVPVQCVSVDSESHLYLAGKSLIATHNSTSGFQKALRKIREGKSGAVLAPDFEQFKTSTWEELREWIPWDKVVPKQRYRKSYSWEAMRPFTMVFVNGARMYCKGLKDPESARGSNINWLMYDEGRRDPTGLGWKNAISAVRVGVEPQAWCTTTPAHSQHWTSTFFSGEMTPELLRILEDVGADRTQELFAVYETSIERNRENLDPMFYASIIATYPKGYLRAREVEGKVADEEGSLGDRGWFEGKILSDPPEWMGKKIRFWDLAATEKKMTKQGKKNDPDETVGSLVTTDADKKRFCLLDQTGGHWAWRNIKEMVLHTAIQDGHEVEICFEQEPGSGGKNQIAELQEFLKAELPEWKTSELTPKDYGDRVMAANVWFGEASEGNWWILRGLWNESFFSQLDYFPNPAIHDDRITSVSGARHKIAPVRRWKKVNFMAVGMVQNKDEVDGKKENVKSGTFLIA